MTNYQVAVLFIITIKTHMIWKLVLQLVLSFIVLLLHELNCQHRLFCTKPKNIMKFSPCLYGKCCLG